MKEKIDKLLSNRNQTSVFLWLIAGGYLVYLAYQILSGDMGSANRWVLYVFCALFIIVGLAIVALALYSLIGKRYQMQKPPAEDEEDSSTEDG